MRLTQLLLGISFFLGISIYAQESDVVVSEFAVLKAAVNTMVQIFIEFVQHAGPVGTAVGMTTMVLMELSSVIQEQDKIEQQTDFNRLSERMDALQFSVDHLLNEVKFQTLIKYQSEIKAEFDHFRQIVLAFGSDKKKQNQEITQFIGDYKSKNLENKIANYLNEASSLSKSLRITLVDFASSNKNNTGCHMRSSPNKLIYDFHVATLLSIYKGNMLLFSCYALQDQLSTDGNLENHKRFVSLRNVESLRKIITSMKASLPLINDQSDLISYNNLRNPVKIDFKNVIQLFLEFNTNLKSRSKWFWFIYTAWNCEEINNDPFKNGDGCFGMVRSCVSTHSTCMGCGLIHAAVGDAANYYSEFGRLSEDPDRIYSYYGLRPTVWEQKNHGCNEMFSRVCACICDQREHPRTERSLYGGIISAPQGYIITGVRFQKHSGVIYLQAQVGELMAGAFVNKSSVHWLDPPDNLKANALNFTYDLRKLLLDDLYFDDAVLTGYQFYYHLTRKFYALKLFGKSLLKPDFGSLDENELVKTSNETEKLLDKNLETKVPGLVEWKESYKVTLGNSSIIVKFGASNQKMDAGQTFIPFFDGSDAMFEVESPLAGIGLLHYTNDPQYAGYIRPYLRSYNYGNVLSYYETYLKNTQKTIRLAGKN